MISYCDSWGQQTMAMHRIRKSLKIMRDGLTGKSPSLIYFRWLAAFCRRSRILADPKGGWKKRGTLTQADRHKEKTENMQEVVTQGKVHWDKGPVGASVINEVL